MTTPRADLTDGTVEKRIGLGGDRRLTYAEYGHSDGVPVVFLHGTPGSRVLGRLCEEGAREHGLRVIAPDRPGSGRSTPWPDRSLGDAGKVLDAVLDDAGVETAGIVAFSGGAPHALASARTRPERVDRIDLISGATPPAVREETPRTQRVLTGMARTAPGVLRGLFRGQAWLAARLDPAVVLSQYTAEPGAVPEEAADTVRADFLAAFAEHRRGPVEEFRMAADWDLDFEAVTTEVCLWHGSADENVPVEGARRLGERLPDASLQVLDGADHLQTLLECLPDVLANHR